MDKVVKGRFTLSGGRLKIGIKRAKKTSLTLSRDSLLVGTVKTVGSTYVYDSKSGRFNVVMRLSVSVTASRAMTVRGLRALGLVLCGTMMVGHPGDKRIDDVTSIEAKKHPV